MKTKLQTALASIAPSIFIRTEWARDEDLDLSIFDEGDALEKELPENWICWQSEVRATAIVNGEEITGSAHLGGTWEKSGDEPSCSNPEISGYENQMTVEALEGLGQQITDVTLVSQIVAAIKHCKAEAKAAYDE